MFPRNILPPFSGSRLWNIGNQQRANSKNVGYLPFSFDPEDGSRMSPRNISELLPTRGHDI
jgi:hypothetical protein